MKIHRVLLENFGIYTRQEFLFDGAPLTLVYGPNESGKSTALNGLRNALCGFPLRSPYLTGKTMQAEVSGQLNNGTEFSFSRKKGRRDDLSGRLGNRRIDSEDIAKMLGNIDLETYQQMFGFTLDELREGEKSLKNARLAEALAGGGMGGANVLQHLRTNLDEATQSLFRNRGSSRIANILGDIRTTQDELRKLQTLPAAIEDIRLRLHQANEQRENNKLKFAGLHGELSRCDRLSQALPIWQSLNHVDATLGKIEIPEGVDANFIAQWSDYAQQLSTLTHSLQEETQKLEMDRQQISTFSHGNQIPADEAALESLGHLAEEIPQARKRLTEAKQLATESSSSLQQALESLGIKSPDEKMLALSLSVPQRNAIEERAAQCARLERDLLSAKAKLESNREQLRSLQQPTEGVTVPENLDNLSELLQSIAAEESIQQQLVDSVCEKCESAEFEVVGARLRARIEDCPNLDYAWPIPSLQDVDRFLRLNENSQRDLSNLRRDILKLELALQALDREIEVTQSECDQSNWGELKAIAKRRDATVEGWLDELSEPLLACSITVEQQRLRLEQLKTLFIRSDQLLEHVAETAETLAKVSQLKRRRQETEGELNGLRLALDQALQIQSDIDVQWTSAWQGCPFKPASPEAMRVWVSDFEAWSRVAAQLDIERRKLVASRAKLKQWRHQLLDAWPAVIDPEAPIDELKERWEQWSHCSRQLQSDTSRLAAAKAMLDDAQTTHDQLESEQNQLQTKYRDWLSENGLPEGWPLTQVTQLIDNLDRVRRERRTLENLQSQIKELQSTIHGFDSGVARLAESIGIAVPAVPEVLARQWLADLQLTRRNANERARLTASIDFRFAKIAELKKRIADIETRLTALSSGLDTESGAVDRATFDAMMQRAQQAAELRIQRNELVSNLQTLCGREALPTFIDQLRQADPAALALKVSELKRELTILDQNRQQIEQEVGGLNNQLEQLSKSESAQRCQQHVHGLRAQLVDLSEQWIVHRLAQELLSRCIERFRRDNEPALLQTTHQLLSKLTGGIYQSVDYDAGQGGSFIVRKANQEAVEPERLSTGTREQLYLAIRMAFIAHYGEQHEPLPVLMDDCFVNFDDVRARYAIQALLDWHASIQTILFSCHGRIVQMVAELAPETPVICLDRNTTMAAREMAGELASA